ncbi:hypothetical protein I7I53_04411 [Histoplasma capsulatum var. duboisii H88]|uniref:Uncharacterized protein n=1 Tax=Ajellomyces capsulatus (strain H88) TaxID=544711 RepID=A0A8A1LSF3_AJEC8|nr:hypothetical protein I7I53_04411 [Histoplasma capsulatum var. duboisii H88]
MTLSGAYVEKEMEIENPRLNPFPRKSSTVFSYLTPFPELPGGPITTNREVINFFSFFFLTDLKRMRLMVDGRSIQRQVYAPQRKLSGALRIHDAGPCIYVFYIVPGDTEWDSSVEQQLTV